jgi:CubicO group peptidase (beta-lactamase class C family)
MHDPMTFEARLVEAHGRYADGADADIAALDPAAAIATGSRRGRRSLPRLTWLVGAAVRAAVLLPVSPVAARGVSMRFATVALALVLGLAGCSSTSASAPPSSTPAVAPPTARTTPAAPTAAPDLASQFRKILGPDFNGSALVTRDGDRLFAEGIGVADDANGIPNTPETRFRLGSVTKQFTAMAVLMLASQGLLKTTDSVCDYVDTCPDGWDVVTIEHLLSHSSGIADFTDQPAFDISKAATPAETVGSVADIPLAFEPGASFAYCSTGYVLLGMVIERVSGLDYETFLEQRIFEPLGMADSGYEHADTPGLAVGYASEFEEADALDTSVPYAAGGLYSTVLDLERWVDALDADALVDAAAMQRFVTPLADMADGGKTGYAYGVNVGDVDGHRVVSHEGVINGFNSFLAWYPDDGLTIALLTNRPEGPDLVMAARRAAALALESP